MAQTSTTLLASKSHIADKTGTIISFTKTGTEYKLVVLILQQLILVHTASLILSP